MLIHLRNPKRNFLTFVNFLRGSEADVEENANERETHRRCDVWLASVPRTAQPYSNRTHYFRFFHLFIFFFVAFLFSLSLAFLSIILFTARSHQSHTTTAHSRIMCGICGLEDVHTILYWHRPNNNRQENEQFDRETCYYLMNLIMFGMATAMAWLSPAWRPKIKLNKHKKIILRWEAVRRAVSMCDDRRLTESNNNKQHSGWVVWCVCVSCRCRRRCRPLRTEWCGEGELGPNRGSEKSNRRSESVIYV